MLCERLWLGPQRGRAGGRAHGGGGELPGRERALPVQGARRAAHAAHLQGLPAAEGQLQVLRLTCYMLRLS